VEGGGTYGFGREEKKVVDINRTDDGDAKIVGYAVHTQVHGYGEVHKSL